MVAIVTGNGLGFERTSGFVLGANGQLGSSAFGRYGENVFVNAATGNLMINRTDEVLIGRGEDDVVSRSYNSLGRGFDDNGDNWNFGAQRKLVFDFDMLNSSGGQAWITDADGAIVTYTYDSSRGLYVNEDGAGAYDTLSLSSTTNLWTQTDGTTQSKDVYSYYGVLQSSSDIDGNSLTYGYDAQGRLSTVTTANGETTTYVWSGTSNNVSQIITTLSGGATLSRVYYTYDSHNRLSTVTTDLSPTDNSISDGNTVVTTYTYVGATDLVSSIAQTGGALLAITYDALNRVSTLTQTTASGVTSVTSLTYNSWTLTSITDPLGNVTKMTYDASDQLTTLTLPPAQSGATAEVYTYVYDTNGNVTSETDSAGNTTTFQYDNNGNVTQIMDAAGDTEVRDYDAMNHVVTDTVYRVAAVGGTGQSQPATTRYAYDSEGHLRYTVTPTGEVTEYDYNASGQMTSSIVYRDNVYSLSGLHVHDTISESQLMAWASAISDKSTVERTDYTYDARGNLQRTTAYSAANTDGTGNTSASFNRVFYVYDQAGNLLSRQSANMNTETFVYDGLNRLTSSVNIEGGTTTIVYNDGVNKMTATSVAGATTVSTYNYAGELITTKVNGTGIPAATTSYAYDADGRLRMVTDSLGNRSYYLYDAIGRKVADIAANGAMTEYVYDSGNRLVETIGYATLVSAANLAALVDVNGNPTNVTLASIRPATNSGDLLSWRIYDQASRLIETIDGAGDAVIYTYDGMSNLVATHSYANSIASVSTFRGSPPTTLQTPVADAVRDIVTRSFYDDDGRLIGTLDGAGDFVQIFYNGAGEKTETIAYATIVSQSLRAAGTFAQIVTNVGSNAKDLTTRYFYDGEGELRFTLDSALRPTEYAYSPAGQLLHMTAYGASITATGTYTLAYVTAQAATLASNPLTETSWNVYDTAGNLAYTIDALGQVTSYSYDASGNVIKAVRYTTARSTPGDPSASSMATWVSGHSTVNDRTSRTFYDVAGRVLYQVDPLGYVTQYFYDTDNRVTKEVHYADPYTISDSDTSASVGTLIGSIPASAIQLVYSYDGGGRLTDSYDGDGFDTHLVYNALGQVIQSIAAYGTGDASITAYTYDAAGRVATETSASTASEASATANSYNGLGQLTSVQVASGTGDSALTQFTYDADGRVLSETDAAGVAESSTTSYTYDAFGHVLTKVDGRGTSTTYTYDTLGRLSTASVPLDATTNAVTTYLYDALNRVIEITDPNGGNTFNFYDALNRINLQVDADGYATGTTYTIGGAIASVTHYATKLGTVTPGARPNVPANGAEDATTTFTRDKLDRLTATTDAMGFTESYTLDAFGNRITVVNKLGGITNNIFNKRGLLTRETMVTMASVRSDGTTEASSVSNTYSYDGRGNRIQMVQASGLADYRTTSYAYDKLDRLTSTSGDSVQTVGNDLATITNVTPTVTNKYDRRGNVIETDDANGARTLYYYDDLNRVIAKIDALGDYTVNTYDKDGNLTAVRTYGVAIALPSSPGGTPPVDNSSNYRETDFTFDLGNRMKTATVASLRTGSLGTNYTTSIGNVVTSYVYDKDGNLIQQTDGRGNSTFIYYDKMSRKIASVDAENYLTFDTLDADGNVVTEERFATRLPATPTTASDPVALRASVAGNANDRITNFAYDKNGRRLTETRTGVVAWVVNTSNGGLTAASTSSTITYTYNGLGEVTSKTEATGDLTSYAYDAYGRETTVTGPSFTGYTGTSVQGVLTESYDGLNNLTRSVQNSTRITSYTYGAGGRLATMTDASGFAQTYGYDANGNMVKISYARLKSDGTTVTEAQATRYDLLGRNVFQSVATLSGTTWTFGDQAQTQYDAFGEITGRGVNGMIQETYSYDAGGHLWRSTAGDGSVRLFAYDADGNQSLEIDSDGNGLPTGYSWSTITLEQAITLLTNNGTANVGTVAVSGMVVTMTAYDKRNMQTEVREPMRQLSTTSTNNTISHKQTYNAFGEVASQTDSRGYVTNFNYNTMGKVIQQINPSVSYTSTNGTIASASPTTASYFDLSGRLVGTMDADGNVNTRSLLAGTGYDGDDALVVKEFHADSGVITNGYDAFDDLRQTTDEVGKVEAFTYDNMDRLLTDTHQARPAGTPGNNTGATVQLVDSYAYDGLGQRIQHWNSQYGASVKETTDYDQQGRVIKMVDLGGNTTTYSYVWSNTIATTGMGTFGGWTKTTVNAAGVSETENQDYFGRTVGKTDFGANTYGFVYNAAGELVVTTNATGEDLGYTYYNTGQLSSADQAYSVTTWIPADNAYDTEYYDQISTYTYDTEGNRTNETYADTQHGTYENATVTWDAMNRMVTYSDTGGTLGAPASISWEYDLDGNIRHMAATYRQLDVQGNILSTNSTQDYWYTYDSMNRFVISKGYFSGTRGSGSIVAGALGVIAYNLDGQRASVTTTQQDSWRDGETGHIFYYTETDSEQYVYTADGYLAEVDMSVNYTGITDGQTDYTLPEAKYVYDAMGRVTDYTEYTTSGALAYERTAVYDAKSEVTSDVVTIHRTDNTTWVTSTTYDYLAGVYNPNTQTWTYNGAYQGGVVIHTRATTTKNGAAQPTSDTVYKYAYIDDADQEVSDTFQPDITKSAVNTSTYTYDLLGHIQSVKIVDGRPRTVSFVTDTNGLVLQRDEADNQSGGDPRELHYYFNGIPVGDVSNNGTSDVDYAVSIADHTAVQGTGAFQNGSATSTSYADFDLSYDPINGLNYQSSAEHYTVVEGDTLESIAQQLWGDSSFWYMIADANGMSGDADLVAGQDLIIPNKIHNDSNSSSVYRPYDPNEALGNLSPTAPKVPKHHSSGCGILGQILMMVVAAVVTFYTAGAATEAMMAAFSITAGSTAATVVGIAGAMIGAAVGSIAGQGVGMALGIQKSLNWSAVGMAAISAGVTKGLGPVFNDVGLGGTDFPSQFAQGAISNAVTQGIEVATGLQKSFNWTNVAVAGVTKGVSSWVGQQIDYDPKAPPTNFVNDLLGGVAGMAGAIAGAATKSLITGTDFGDNVVAALPGAISKTIGSLIEGELIDATGYNPQPPAAPATSPAPSPGQGTTPTATVAYTQGGPNAGSDGGGTFNDGVYRTDGSNNGATLDDGVYRTYQDIPAAPNPNQNQDDGVHWDDNMGAYVDKDGHEVVTVTANPYDNNSENSQPDGSDLLVQVRTVYKGTQYNARPRMKFVPNRPLPYDEHEPIGETNDFGAATNRAEGMGGALGAAESIADPFLDAAAYMRQEVIDSQFRAEELRSPMTQYVGEGQPEEPSIWNLWNPDLIVTYGLQDNQGGVWIDRNGDGYMDEHDTVVNGQLYRDFGDGPEKAFPTMLEPPPPPDNNKVYDGTNG